LPPESKRAHLTSSPGARPSGRFTVRMEVKETIDLRAGDVEAASTPRSGTVCIWGELSKCTQSKTKTHFSLDIGRTRYNF
jgi:hypothetical protein